MARDLEPIHGPACTVPTGAVYPGLHPPLPGGADFRPAPAGKLVLHCEPFADPLRLPRGERQQALQDTVDRYAQRLEHYALMSPLDWFNFSISGICQSPVKE